MAALSFCENLKTLRLQSCRKIDTDPGPEEHLGSCPTIERLQLQWCQLRDKRSLHALFMVCESVREIMFQVCWGLDNEMFRITSICRWVKFLSLKGCSLSTTEGLESEFLSWKDLQRLTVISCNKVKDDEVTPALASLFSVLKELKWRPDSKSVLAMSLAGTGIGKKGARFFRKVGSLIISIHLYSLYVLFKEEKIESQTCFAAVSAGMTTFKGKGGKESMRKNKG
ncbi:hypothetical protein COCNU_07G005700 [Cocos nucifera]|uniref:Uncharacterized protein n=1 Tax=Cocos nucifera TaxID=13894 RepID=A0A8K0IEQ6_COCNU|nr:hypothetical protein COCNU_07G005700 [Cocos nucifera]